MIIFIGDEESAKPYDLLGFTCYRADTPEKAREILYGIDAADAEAVFITEDLFSRLEEFISALDFRIVAVPGISGGKGAGADYMKRILRKALGTEIE